MEATMIPLALVLIVFVLGDAIACAIPIDYIRNDLNRLGCSPKLQRAIPKVKFLAVAGLIVGLWRPQIGVLACAGLFVYFSIALQFHMQAKDPIVKFIPALAVMSLVCATLFLSYR